MHAEKKQMYSHLLKEVQIFEAPKENGQIIRSLKFTFPIDKIKKYVAEHYDEMKAFSLNIAQVKQMNGIIERENYNLSKAENSKQPKCPLKQEKAIMDALKAFQMI